MSTANAEATRMLWARSQLWLRSARSELHLFGAAVARRPDGRPLEFPLLHLAWIAHLEYAWTRGLHAGIFGSGSAGFAVTLAAWLLGKDPTERVALVCGSDSVARLRGKAVRQITGSKAFDKVFPGALSHLRWSDHLALPDDDAVAATDPVLEVRGASSRPVGGAFTRVIFDGVPDAGSTSTHQRRKEQRRMVDDTWFSRLAPGGRVLWVARPWNPDDASYALRARPDFVWLEQRPRADGAGWEQEVVGAGADYAAVVRQRVAWMLSTPPGG